MLLQATYFKSREAGFELALGTREESVKVVQTFDNLIIFIYRLPTTVWGDGTQRVLR